MVMDVIKGVWTLLKGTVGFVSGVISRILELLGLVDSVGYDVDSDLEKRASADGTDATKGVLMLVSMMFLGLTREPKKSWAESAIKVALPLVSAGALATMGVRYLITILPEGMQNFLIKIGAYRPYGELSRAYSVELAKLSGFHSDIVAGKELTIKNKLSIIRCFNVVDGIS